jgi:hypothetical protein
LCMAVTIYKIFPSPLIPHHSIPPTSDLRPNRMALLPFPFFPYNIVGRWPLAAHRLLFCWFGNGWRCPKLIIIRVPSILDKKMGEMMARCPYP